MNPDVLLSIIATLSGFVLKTTLAFVVCLVLSRLVESPNSKFVVWSAFLYGSAGYWLLLANAALAGGHSSQNAPHALLRPVTAAVATWQIPDSWAFPLGLALRALGIGYLLIVSYMAFAHLKKRWHLKWVLGFTSEPSPEIAQRFQALAGGLGVGRSRLLILSGATSPATFGWIRPTVLLPALCLEQDCSELEDILRHELHHVRRRDSLWNGLATACRALLFFHPAAWYAVRRMQFDRELACDLAVVSHAPARREDYAESLIHFARLNLAQEAKTWGIDFAASAEALTVRVHSILAGTRTTPGWLRCLRGVSAIALFLLFLGIVPSLAVLLSYVHRPMLQSSTEVTDHLSQTMAPVARATRTIRSLPITAHRNLDAGAVASRTENTQQPEMDMQDPMSANRSSGQRSSGPQLLHRPSSATPDSNTKSQTVALIDTDASGQEVKSGAHGVKQSLEQSAATALSLYKQLSTVDRH
jgi:beta-lactamase regulating signal transducer with metallopeptidase domain